MSIFKDKIRKQILEGTKYWVAPDLSEEALKLFEMQVVRPLQDLAAEGQITLGEPHFGSYGFGKTIDLMLVLDVHSNENDTGQKLPINCRGVIGSRCLVL